MKLLSDSHLFQYTVITKASPEVAWNIFSDWTRWPSFVVRIAVPVSVPCPLRRDVHHQVRIRPQSLRMQRREPVVRRSSDRPRGPGFRCHALGRSARR